MIETDSPWCDIRPTHAGYAYLSNITDQYQTKKKEKFELGCLVKGRNEPCQIGFIFHLNPLTKRNVLDIIARVKEVDSKELSEIIYDNTKRVFKF